jgi:mannitol-specific phosphotransferase system IIBC component
MGDDHHLAGKYPSKPQPNQQAAMKKIKASALLRVKKEHDAIKTVKTIDNSSASSLGKPLKCVATSKIHSLTVSCMEGVTGSAMAASSFRQHNVNRLIYS